jgi:hypothetical protein
MIDPTEDQILRKAKELCREDGNLWSEHEVQNATDAQKEVMFVLDDAGRTEYLNRAADQLQREG